MKKLIYGIIIALFCSGCDDFLKEYSQSQTVAKEVSHFDDVLLGDGYLPAQNRAYILTDHAGFLNVMDDDVTTVQSGTRCFLLAELWRKSVRLLRLAIGGWTQSHGRYVAGR
ncbi:MAG: hypothetical protein ACLU30_16290 [Odoribacter splanchnicus]